MHRVAAIIPARYNATRFPGKPLAILKGKPIIQHVFEKASLARMVDSVLVATDDVRIFNEVVKFGGEAVMTSGSHSSGTDRIAEAAEKNEYEIIINVQGDEPFIEPEMIDDIANLLYNDERADISTLAKKVTDIREVLSPHVVKVVTDKEGFALYFSRAPIPYHREEWKDLNHITLDEQKISVFKHIGIYGYRRDSLMKFSSLEVSTHENTEKLEQLRALSSGMKIKVGQTNHETFGIDTIEDLRKAEEWQNISL